MAHYRNEIKRMMAKMIQIGLHYDKSGFGSNKDFKDFSLLELMIFRKIGAQETTTMSELNVDLDIDRNLLTTVVNKLQLDGLLDKKQNVNDKRVINLKMTEKGSRRYQYYIDKEDEFIDFILKKMTVNEEKAVLKFFSQVNQYVLKPYDLENGKQLK